jgi:hypothetical protein
LARGAAIGGLRTYLNFIYCLGHTESIGWPLLQR